jgi:hypothetical protein
LNGIKSFFKALYNLKRAHKTLILILIIIGAALFYNLNNKQEENKEQQTVIELESSIEEIKQLQSQIEANLLYSNEKSAKDLLAQSKEKLDLLRSDSNLSEANRDLFDKYERQMEKIRKASKAELSEVSDFSNLNSQAETDSIILADNRIFGADSGQKTVYLIDLSSGASTAITDMNNSITSLKYPVLDNDGNIYYLGDSSLTRFNSEADEIANIRIDIPEGAEINSAASYNNRLYLLDPKNNQIYRYNKAPGSFSGKIDWVNAGIDLSAAVGMYIDGNIWIIKSNGEIVKLFNGAKEDFALAAIEPNLDSAKKIISPAESNYLYILDSKEKRIIVYNKEGLFIKQYIFPDLNANLKDFIIMENEKKAYILNGNKIYKFDLDHIL